MHLSHRSEALRYASVQVLDEFAQGLPAEVVMAGDFNSSPKGSARHQTDLAGNNAMDFLAETNRYEFSDESNFTFPADQPDRTIDWFVWSKDVPVQSQEVIETALSDHRPVLIEIPLPE